MPNAIEAAAELPEISWFDLPTEEMPQPDYVVEVPANAYVPELIGLDADEAATSQRQDAPVRGRGLLDRLLGLAFGVVDRVVSKPVEAVFENSPMIGVTAVVLLGLALATQVLVDAFVSPFRAIAP